VYTPCKVPIDTLFKYSGSRKEDQEINEHTKILMNNYQGNKVAMWTSHRVVQSQTDETKRKLSEEKRKNKQLEARVRELQKDRMKMNFNDDQKTYISSKEQKDEIMQNVNSLMNNAKYSA